MLLRESQRERLVKEFMRQPWRLEEGMGDVNFSTFAGRCMPILSTTTLDTPFPSSVAG